MERIYTVLLDRGGSAARSRMPDGLRHPCDHASVAEAPRPALHRERLSVQELQELAEEPDFVAAAEIMQTRLLAPVPDEPGDHAWADGAGGRHAQSWGIGAVGADRSKYSGADVAVALLDTGIDAGHAAFRGVHLIEKDFTGGGNGDADGHGTHSAGIVFGRNVDGVRIGVAPGIRQALIGKVLGPEGGDSEMLARALLWAHEQGAHVIAVAAGLDFAATVRRRIEQGWASGSATAAALEAYCANLTLLDRLLRMLGLQEPFTGGAIVVAAAGNDSRRGKNGEFVMAASPPCGADKVIGVGALDPARVAAGHDVSSFSNCGVGLTAPGRGIVSAAAGGGLTALSGTGSAAAHVAGIAALWWQAIRQSSVPVNATLVRGKLLSSARRDGFSPVVYAGERGAGRVAAPLDGAAVASLRPALQPAAGQGFGAAEVWADRRGWAERLEPIALRTASDSPNWRGGSGLC